MKDLTIALENRPGALAEMGDALGRAGVSIEGGGAFVVNGQGVAHFLFKDGSAARRALEAAGIRVLEERDVLVQRLNQEEPGQLGKITRRMVDAGVNIEVLYSDHDHQLILVVDDIAKGRTVSEAWTREQKPAPPIVALTGFMGAGKTSIGHALAALLGWDFIDLDHEIELHQKAPIRELFRPNGEPQFREIETEALRRMLHQVSAPAVIALGGGTFIQTANVELLRSSGARVVFLEAPVEQMFERCRPADHASAENLRPLAADPEAFRALYLERLPQYRTAELTVSTADRSAEDSAREIAESLHLGRRGGSAGL
jgi:shikimate kinase